MMANVYLLAVILTLLVGTSEGNEKHMICKDVEDVFSADDGVTSLTSRRHMGGIRGKSGQKGSKGDEGNMGPPGTSAEVDYVRVEAMVGSRVDAELRRLNDKLDRMNEMNEQLQNRLNKTEKIIEELGFKLKSIEWEKLCNFTYQEKCFFGIFPNRTSRTVNYQEAEELCAQKNSEASNIYSEDQYNMLVTYMRSEIPSNMKWIEAWLGMKANPSAGTYTLANGDPAPYFNWYPGFPSSDSSWTRFAIEIQKDPTSDKQGMVNYYPSGNLTAVICELQMN